MASRNWRTGIGMITYSRPHSSLHILGLWFDLTMQLGDSGSNPMLLIFELDFDEGSFPLRNRLNIVGNKCDQKLE